MRINKYLATCELGSRRKVEEYIKAGKITINDKVVTDLSYDVRDGDDVKYNGKSLTLVNKKVYIMLNKPKCYISSQKDEKDRKLAIDLLKGVKEKVFGVGRLDYNTQGLLLFTNDGDWANNIIHPSKHISKTYEVKIKVMPTTKQLNSLRRGIVLDGQKTLPADVEIVGMEDSYVIVHITIYEGRNREIRRMFEYLNIKIYALKRLSIGLLELGDLAEGKYRYLKNNEKELVFGGKK